MLKAFFDKYGLSFVMVASYFGSGSIFIAADAGVRYGYTLIWAVIGAVLLGYMGQDMSARVGIFGSTLMGFTRRKLGRGGALAIAIFLSIGCLGWCFALTAATGKSIALLLGLAEPTWKPIAFGVGIVAVLTGILDYSKTERIMTTAMFVLLVLYVIVAGYSGPSLPAMAAGVLPQFADDGAILAAVAILGTTALWPNFFLESILVKAKGWTEAEDLKAVRKDLRLGYIVGGIITLAILVVSASVLRPAGYTELDTFLTPGLALAEILGDWAAVVFLIGVGAAAFSSIVPIMWTPAYMIMEALDLDPHEGQTTTFKMIYAPLVLLGSLSPFVSALFGLSVVQMVILFPAYNGVVGLPVSALLLFWAVNDRTELGEHRNGWKMNLANVLLVLLSLYFAVSSGSGILEAIVGGVGT